MAAHTLSRDERLRSRSAMERLFAEGKRGFVYPLRYVVLSVPAAGEPAAQVLFQVPKRLHRRANRRNLLRRRTKEAYRLSKQILLADAGPVDYRIALIYAVPELSDFATIDHAVREVLRRIRRA